MVEEMTKQDLFAMARIFEAKAYYARLLVLPAEKGSEIWLPQCRKIASDLAYLLVTSFYLTYAQTHKKIFFGSACIYFIQLQG